MPKKKKNNNNWTPYDGNTTYIDSSGKETDPLIVSSDGKRGWTLDDVHRQLVNAVQEDGLMSIEDELETLSDETPDEALVSLVQIACDSAGALGEFIAEHVPGTPGVIEVRRREEISASAD